MIRAPILAIALAGCGSKPPPPAASKLRTPAANELLAVADFASITDRAQRSRALFTELDRVIQHPRCVNCHPAGDSPHQRSAMEPHDPPVVRGPKNAGIAGLECATCHQDRNQPMTRVPGAPKWQLAPIELAWYGKSAAYICHQLQDPQRNGGKSHAQLVEHSAHDELVGWAWHPGADREPAPGTQAAFGALVAAWLETGAECPEEAAR